MLADRITTTVVPSLADEHKGATQPAVVEPVEKAGTLDGEIYLSDAQKKLRDEMAGGHGAAFASATGGWFFHPF